MTSAAELGLQQFQFNWAVKVVAVVKARKLPERAAHIAISTCLTESGLKMLANQNNPASLLRPHDAVGSDHGSVGLYQQQVGGAVNSTANWGTTAQCMDVNYSTNAFLDALLRIDWQALSNWDAAQKVQGSFDPTGGNYRRNDARAIQIAHAIWVVTSAPTPVPTPPTPAPGPGKTPAGTRYFVRSGDTLAGIAHKYPDADITWQYLAAINHLVHPDVLTVGQVLWIRPSKVTPPVVRQAVVRSGDTLGVLAKRYGTSVPQLVAWNRGRYPSLVTNVNDIKIGWVLHVG